MKYNFDEFIENYDEYFSSYLESVRKDISPALLKVYEEGYSRMNANRFHDCAIINITIIGESRSYRKKNDKIKMIFRLSRTIEYRLEFLEISKFKYEYDFFRDEDYLGPGIMGEIIDCLIGVSEDGNQFMEFITSTAAHCYIEFRKIRIEKLKLY